MWLWAAAALMSLGSCRLHTLADGDYSLQVEEVLRDDCGLMNPPSDVQGAARLRTEGNWVSLSFLEPQLRLVGNYLENTEAMALDGSLSNASTVLRGRACMLDVITFHLDATTIDTHSFSGSMAINYVARQPDECTCNFWFRYRAEAIQ